MDIREVTSRDVSTYEKYIRMLLRRCIDSTFSIDNIEEIIDNKIESMLNHLKDGSAFISGAFAGECLCGLVWAYPITGIQGKVFHVAYISVDLEHESMGIGRALLNEAEKKAKELRIDSVEMIVAADNYVALRLYNQQKYKTDRLIMRKSIGIG